MKYDKDEIKNSLTIEQVEQLVAELGGEPRRQGNYLVCATICHNHPGEGSHKLYYYNNTKLFRCYTECDDTFDIFQLLIKIHKQNGEDWTLYNAESYIVNYFSLDFEEDFFEERSNLQDWQIFSKYKENNQKFDNKKIINLQTFDDSFLHNLPQPHIIPWEKEGISYNIEQLRGIRFDPANYGVVIPHYNIDNKLVGVRERTLVKENEIYGKYRPAVINRKMYNHPLGYNLYNLNNSKTAIAALHKAVVFEGEKSSLLYASMFGPDNDISVACCGSNLISYQFKLLYNLGVNEIIIAFDRQFQTLKDKEWQGWTKKLKDIHNKYGSIVQISFMFDLDNKLNYKDSPIDQGKDTFMYLFQNRIQL